MLLTAYTLFHVIISLVAILTGFVVLGGFFRRRLLEPWNTVFLWTTIATSVTGFFFPVTKFMPSHGVGIISLLLLIFTVIALYKKKLAGGWNRTYAITGAIALYLNVFVLVVQGFRRVPWLNALAPNQSEPPFAIAQGGVLLLFIILATLALRQYLKPVPAI